jgi:hypothetical protein
MPVLGKGRVVWDVAIEAEPAKPAISEVQMDLFVERPLGTNAIAVADQQHPHQRFRINRRPAG